MRLPSFWGGIHPPQNKELTVNKEIENYLPVSELVFPMAQNLGALSQPVVKKGDNGTRRTKTWRQRCVRFCSNSFKCFWNS